MSNKANFLDQTSSLTSSLTRKAIEENPEADERKKKS